MKKNTRYKIKAEAVRPATMGTRKSESFSSRNIALKKSAADILVPLLWGNKGKMFDFSSLFVKNGCRRRDMFFLAANC